MSRYFLVLIVCLLSYCANGQQIVQRTYSNIGPNKMIKTYDGGFLICGNHTYSSLKSNALIIKVDSIGQLIWTKSFEDTIGLHNLIDIIATSDQNYLAVFLTNTSNPIKLIKFNNNGDILNTTHYISNSIYSLRGVFEAENGNIIAYGFALSAAIFSGPVDFFIMKTDSNLNVIWAKQINYKYQSQFIRGLMLSDGSYLFQGTAYDTTPTPTRNDLVLAKTDTAGNFIWFKQSGNFQVGSGMGNGTAIVTNYGDMIEKNGSIYNAFNVGWFSNFYQYDIVIQKLDLNGNEILAHQFGNDAGGTHETQTISGFKQNELMFSTHGHFVKTDDNLNLIWAKRCQPILQQLSILNSLIVSDYCYYGLSMFVNSNIAFSLFTKTDSLGDIGCKGIPSSALFNQQIVVGTYDRLNLLTQSSVPLSSISIQNQAQIITFINDSLQCLTATSIGAVSSKNNLNLSLLENVVSDEIKIQSQDDESILTEFSVYSIKGIQLLKIGKSIQRENIIAVTELQPGFYFLKIHNRKVETFFKFIKL